MRGMGSVNDSEAYVTCGLQSFGLIQPARFTVQPQNGCFPNHCRPNLSASGCEQFALDRQASDQRSGWNNYLLR